MSSSKKSNECIIQSIDRILVFTIGTHVDGQFLMNAICDELGIVEKHWFGLSYIDLKANLRWLCPKDHVDLKKIAPFKETNAHFKFTVNFFPECMRSELVQDVVKTFFFKHEIMRLRDDESVDIPPDTRTFYSAVYSCLVHHEHPDVRPEDYFQKNLELTVPLGVQKRYDLTRTQWEDAIQKFVASIKNQYYIEPIEKALDIAERLPMHGTFFFEISNLRLNPLLLSIGSLGLNIHLRNKKWEPEVAFLWSELSRFSFFGKNFTITPRSEACKPLMFVAQTQQQCQEMLILLIGNHQNFLNRRRDDIALLNEIKAAKIAQEYLDRNRKLFEEFEVLEASYKSYVNFIRQSGEFQDEKHNKLNEIKNEIVENITSQIVQTSLIAKKDTPLAKEKKSDVIRDRQREIVLSKEFHEKGTLPLYEYDRLIPAEKNDTEIARLNALMTCFVNEHNKNLIEFEAFSKSAVKKPLVEVGAPITPGEYDDIRRKDEQEIMLGIKKIALQFEAADKSKNDKSLPQSSSMSRDMSKFETLRLITKNNVQTRVDKFESL